MVTDDGIGPRARTKLGPQPPGITRSIGDGKSATASEFTGGEPNRRLIGRPGKTGDDERI